MLSSMIFWIWDNEDEANPLMGIGQVDNLHIEDVRKLWEEFIHQLDKEYDLWVDITQDAPEEAQLARLDSETYRFDAFVIWASESKGIDIVEINAECIIAY